MWCNKGISSEEREMSLEDMTFEMSGSVMYKFKIDAIRLTAD